MSIANVEGQAHWSSRAASWLSDTDSLESFGGPPGEAAIERLEPRPGENLLDIGCGGGSTTIALARRVQPGGSVLGADIAPEMVVGARQRAEGLGLPIDFTVADVQVHDFGQIFDGAFSRFGVMFFADPVAAFTNIRRTTRRLSFCCWQQPTANEWMIIPGIVALTVLGGTPPPVDPEAPGPYSLADPERVRQILGTAGFGDIDVTPRNDWVGLSEAEIPRWAALSLRHGLANQLLTENPDARSEVTTALEAALHGRASDGVVRLTRAVNLVTAR